MRSRKNRYLSFWGALLFLLAMSVSIEARELREADVRQAVQTWVRQVTADARPEAFVVEMQPYQADGRTVGYIAHLSGGGFCLCGADDLVLPVYFYSPQGTYDPESSEYQLILQEIETRTRDLRQKVRQGDPDLGPYESTLYQRSTLWSDLISGREPNGVKNSKEEPESMVLQLTCHWHQDSPYNELCPELDSNERTLVGSAGLTMAQLMYFWQWPATGEGTAQVTYSYWYQPNWVETICLTDPGVPPIAIWDNRLQWVPVGGGILRMRGGWDQSLRMQAARISDDPLYQTALLTLWSQFMLTSEATSTACMADFSAADYDWSLMEDVHSVPPDAGDDEVAKLCYHAGIAVETEYGVSQSSWFGDHLDQALVSHFRYDPDAIGEQRDISAMTEEIQWGRPLALTGTNVDGEDHAWIVYGYNKSTDPNRQFLVNMGLGGEEDGWYSCDSMPHSFFQYQFVHIAPEDVVRFVGDTTPGDGTPDNPYADIEEAIAAAPDSVTLIFKAGTSMPFTADTLVLDRPMVLKGKMVLGE